MIPKSKLAILIGSLKPKGKEDDEEKEVKDEGDALAECAHDIMEAVKSEDEDALSDALHALVAHIKKEDEEQDKKMEQEEEEDEGEY